MSKNLICLVTVLFLSAGPVWADRGDGGSETANTSHAPPKLIGEHPCDGIASPRPACSEKPSFMLMASVETPEGGIFCSDGETPRRIGYQILDRADGEWDALVTVDGTKIRAMTAYSYFGNSTPPTGFVVALLGEDGSEVLVYGDGENDWLEQGENRYDPCG
ncbi:hypothetical protein V1T76_22815 [Roseibium sp. FZY0029]|uniref:hypothetical protein n=1 Tax=Roseibium sp. FZY0029 TaxID=3116647 RepID=UPI002ECE1F58|nr:hypothetical protein [Roseibium sp. FZY0029]